MTPQEAQQCNLDAAQREIDARQAECFDSLCHGNLQFGKVERNSGT